MTDSYHFRIEPEPREEGAWFDGYFLSEETSRLLFPSGAALQVSGDKIVGRVEAEPFYPSDVLWDDIKPGSIIKVRKPARYTTLSEQATFAAPTGNRLMTLDELYASLQVAIDSRRGTAPEPKRDPLDWNTSTPFDTFADFIVTKGAEPTKPLHTSPTTQGAYPAIAGLLRG